MKHREAFVKGFFEGLEMPFCFACWLVSWFLYFAGRVVCHMVRFHEDHYPPKHREITPVLKHLLRAYQWTMGTSYDIQRFSGNKTPWIEYEPDNENQVG